MVLRLIFLIALVAAVAVLQAMSPLCDRLLPDWLVPVLLLVCLLSALQTIHAAVRWLRTDFAEDDLS